MQHIPQYFIRRKFEDTIGEIVNRTDNTMAKKGTKHKTKIILHREMQHIPQYFIRRKFEDTIGETVNRRTDNTMAKKGTNTQTKNDL
jgi:hypothetical protein